MTRSEHGAGFGEPGSGLTAFEPAGIDVHAPLLGPADPEPFDLEAARLFFAQGWSFELGVAALAQLPDDDMPEVAFAGRSNVGKSSLVNAVTGRKALARISNTPGRTQELNLFACKGSHGRLRIVDLPGYGFARVSKDKVARWTELLKAYLRGRPNLRRALVLIDGRHGIKPVDQEMLRLLDEAAVSYQVILTKADKVRASDRGPLWAKVLQDLRSHVAAHPQVAVTSSETGHGIAELRACITRFAAAPLEGAR
ncbi:MAG: ribosome biogenesis GTP-binding protein YihA/YsxC [Alphaproteobacteria bacterium]